MPNAIQLVHRNRAIPGLPARSKPEAETAACMFTSTFGHLIHASNTRFSHFTRERQQFVIMKAQNTTVLYHLRCAQK
jgi:hypothetical protein